MKLNPPLFLALDVDSRERALQLVAQTAPYVGGYKIGPRLALPYGAKFVSEIARYKPVFLDNKFYDIPNTMDSSVRAAFEMGASFCTVHAGAGREALLRLAETEASLNQKRPFKILAVTVLTSFSAEGRPPHWSEQSISEQVFSLCRLAIESGISGLVCSAEEVAEMRTQFPKSYLGTPGIRFPDDSAGDQKRVMGPTEALRAGASALVVGRPIIESSEPAAAAERFYQSIQGLP